MSAEFPARTASDGAEGTVQCLLHPSVLIGRSPKDFELDADGRYRFARVRLPTSSSRRWQESVERGERGGRHLYTAVDLLTNPGSETRAILVSASPALTCLSITLPS